MLFIKAEVDEALLFGNVSLPRAGTSCNVDYNANSLVPAFTQMDKWSEQGSSLVTIRGRLLEKHFESGYMTMFRQEEKRVNILQDIICRLLGYVYFWIHAVERLQLFQRYLLLPHYHSFLGCQRNQSCAAKEGPAQLRRLCGRFYTRNIIWQHGRSVWVTLRHWLTLWDKIASNKPGNIWTVLELKPTQSFWTYPPISGDVF